MTIHNMITLNKLNKNINANITVNASKTNQCTHIVKNSSPRFDEFDVLFDVSEASNKSNTDHQRNTNGHITEFALGVTVSTNCFNSSSVISPVFIA